MLHCCLKFVCFFLNDFYWRSYVALLFKIWSNLTPSSPILSVSLTSFIIITEFCCTTWLCCNCIKDRLPERLSCLNLYPCVIKFSQAWRQAGELSQLSTCCVDSQGWHFSFFNLVSLFRLLTPSLPSMHERHMSGNKKLMWNLKSVNFYNEDSISISPELVFPLCRSLCEL